MYQVEFLLNHYIQAFLAISLATMLFIYCRKSRVKVQSSCDLNPVYDSGSVRIRKRDKVLRAGKDLVRKIGDFRPLGRHELRRPSLRRRSNSNLHRPFHKLFWSKDENGAEEIPKLKLPEALLEADNTENESQLPPEVLYLLKSVRVFGHFEKPLFVELCKNVETKFLPEGALLFRPGQPLDSVYVVQSGKLSVFMIDSDGSELPLKEVGTGENVHSLLCILDTLIDQPKKYYSIAARALRDTYVLQVKTSAYKGFLVENPDSLLRMIQVIMVRLQRVTLFALVKVFGLGSGLFIQKLKIKGLKILELPCNTQPPPSSEKTPASMVFPVKEESDEDYLEAVDQPVQQPGRTHAKTKRKVRWHGSEEDSTDTDGDPVSQVFVTNTQPDFGAVIEQARLDHSRYMIDKEKELVPPLSKKINFDSAFSFFSTECGDIMKAATKDLMKIFGLEDEALLKGRLQLIEAPEGTTVISEGCTDHNIFFVASGGLTVCRETQEGDEVLLYHPSPGEFVGVLSALTGEPSFITTRASRNSHLVMIANTHLYQILSACPKAICGLAYDLTQRLSTLMRHVDFAVDWMVLEAGKALYKQGDQADLAYVVLNGRLRSVVKKRDGKREIVEEHGRGETVGLTEVITKAQRATTVHAIRDTELAQLPVGLIETTKVKHPEIVVKLITLLGEKVLGSYTKLSAAPISPDPVLGSSTSSTSNLSTIAIVPMTPDVPISHFTRDLCSALSAIDSALRLTSSLVEEKLGTKILDSVSEYRLRTWLGHQEDTHRLVIYQADTQLTAWTHRCIRQADHILLLGVAEKGPTFGKIVKQVEAYSLRVQKELVLLHHQDTKQPTNTRKWLNSLEWVSSYFHVRCPDYFFNRPASPEEEKSLPRCPSRHSDIARLARKLTGTSVGIVLGGGGARGLSQVGVLSVFEEAGIPIDMIGGTSIGAFVGAIYCEELNAERTKERARKWAVRMGHVAEKLFDLTYPITSMFTGQAFNRVIHEVFGEKQIEDLWLPYFCITTDITESRMKVHRLGSLWRYVRSSMSLSGYLPPLCDPVDGHLLLDGGYINNLPADVMSGQGPQTVISVDVGAEDNNDIMNYGDHLSGWWLLWNKYNPFATTVRVPNMAEIQTRLAYVSCVRQLELVKNGGLGEYIRPPIDKIQNLQFGRFEEAARIGYEYCRTVVSGWRKAPNMQHLFTDHHKISRHKKQYPVDRTKQLPVELKKFSQDLAKVASHISQPFNPIHKSTSTDAINIEPLEGEGVGGYWSSPEDNNMFYLQGEQSSESSPEDGRKSPPKGSYTVLSDTELLSSSPKNGR
jgi:lysophospholipid hydrolase